MYVVPTYVRHSHLCMSWPPMYVVPPMYVLPTYVCHGHLCMSWPPMYVVPTYMSWPPMYVMATYVCCAHLYISWPPICCGHLCMLWTPMYVVDTQGFFQDLGQGGAKRQYVIWWGGTALSTCTALDNVAESGGILNPPPPSPILNPFFSEHLV